MLGKFENREEMALKKIKIKILKARKRANHADNFAEMTNDLSLTIIKEKKSEKNLIYSSYA